MMKITIKKKLIVLLLFNFMCFYGQNQNFTATYTSTYIDDTVPIGQVNAGDKIQYTIKIENTTGSEITNITLTNPASYNAVLTGTTIASLASGSFDDTTFSLLQTISANDMTKGVVYYDAELSGTINGNSNLGILIDGVPNLFLTSPTGFCGSIATNLDIASYTISETPYIIDDTAPLGTLNAGDKVKYNYSFTNTGLVDLALSNTAQNPDWVNLSLLAGQTSTSFSQIRHISNSDIASGYMYHNYQNDGYAPFTTCPSEYYNTAVKVSSSAVSTVPCNNCPPNPNGGTVFSLAQNLQFFLTGEYQDTSAPFGTANVGDAIVYTYTIKNIGSETLTNVHITDAAYPVSGNPITSLAPNEVNATNFTSTHIIESDDILVNGGWAVNSAIVRGTLPSNVEVYAKSVNPENTYYFDDYYSPLYITCETCTLTKFDVYPNMTILYEDTFEDLTAPFGFANVGDKINYSISVENTGNVNFPNLSINGIISNLIVGATDNTSFTHSHTITQYDINRGYVANSIFTYGVFPSIAIYSDGYNHYSFSSTDPTPCTIDCPDNYPSNYTITKLNIVSLVLSSEYNDTMPPFNSIANVGETITYTYKIKNKLEGTITNISITDPNAVVSGSLGSLAANTTDETSFIGTHTITQADINAGRVINQATLSFEFNGENYSVTSVPINFPQYYNSNDGNTYTNVKQHYELLVTSEDTFNDVALPLNNVNVGDTVTYTVNITNNSNVDLSNIQVQSSNAILNTNSLLSLAIGASDNTTFTATHSITNEDLNIGYVYNLISAKVDTNTDPYSSSYTIFNATDLTPCMDCPNNSSINYSNVTQLYLNNAIKINAFVDTNANGVKDPNESDFPLGKFYYNVNDGSTQYEITTTNGIHFLNDNNPMNSYDINFVVSPEYAYNYNSATTYSNITIGENVVTYYFPVTVLPYNDTEINLLPIGAPPRPGFTYLNVVSYTNNGNQTVQNGTVTFTKNNVSSLISVSETNATITPNGFTYDFTNLLPFETRTITVTMQNPTLPVVDFGQVLTNVASISIPTNDINVNNNTSTLSQSIVGSFDPNDKAESHNGEIVYNTFSINDYLTYTIRFENTGNYPAEFVTVIDELESKLDETSVKMIAASHPYTLTRQNNKLTWLFDNIQLQPSVPNSTIGHGFLVFKIKPKAGFVIGDVISNIANIYFDYNPPIITNVCSTEFVPTLSNPNFETNNFHLFPNPVKDIMSISSKELIKNIKIYAVLGQLIYEKSVEDTTSKIDISNFNKGIYLVKIQGINAAQSFKISKE